MAPGVVAVVQKSDNARNLEGRPREYIFTRNTEVEKLNAVQPINVFSCYSFFLNYYSVIFYHFVMLIKIITIQFYNNSNNNSNNFNYYYRLFLMIVKGLLL